MQPDGKILVCGIAGQDGIDENASVWRLGADGGIDTSLATSGNYIYDVAGTNEGAATIGLIDNGRIIVAGDQRNGSAWAAVLLANGQPDSTFRLPITKPGQVSQVLVQPDGLIVLVGIDGGDPFVWRLLESGTPDPAFNGGSPVAATSVTTTYDAPNAALDAYGRVLVTTGAAVVRFCL